MNNKKEFLLALITAPQSESHRIAQELLNHHLAACVNIVPVKSIYFWKGKLESEPEDLLIIKTRAELFDPLKELVKSIHPYEVPEIIAVAIKTGNEEYLNWILENTT